MNSCHRTLDGSWKERRTEEQANTCKQHCQGARPGAPRLVHGPLGNCEERLLRQHRATTTDLSEVHDHDPSKLTQRVRGTGLLIHPPPGPVYACTPVTWPVKLSNSAFSFVNHRFFFLVQQCSELWLLSLSLNGDHFFVLQFDCTCRNSTLLSNEDQPEINMNSERAAETRHLYKGVRGEIVLPRA